MGLIVDNFAGGGGASTGIEAALGRAVDIAINHDEEAIRMHEANHPGTRFRPPTARERHAAQKAEDVMEGYGIPIPDSLK